MRDADMPPRPTVVLAAGSDAWASRVREVLRISRSLELSAETRTTAGIIRLCLLARPSIVLVDWSAPLVDVYEVLHAIRVARLPTRAALFAGREVAVAALDRAVSDGAAGCVSRAVDPITVPGVLLAIAATGQFVCSPELWAVDDPVLARRSRQASRLSPRETQVLELCSHGERTKQIAQRLGIGPETVETTIRRAREKLGTSTRTHAVAEAMRHGILGSYS